MSSLSSTLGTSQHAPPAADFHFWWAATRALELIKPGADSTLVTLEGLSRIDDADDDYEAVDVGVYFGGDDLDSASDAAHHQLAGPLVVVRDNLGSHVSAAMTELVGARDWLTVCQLPPYAHELNPVEPAWSHLKRSLTDLAKRKLAQLMPGQVQAQADAIPARTSRRLPRQHRPGPRTLL